ncbi:hypothetical protein [Curtobacterium herbarum]|uniref:Uncharacterized protein n=1 Tax=Curtobacterium herbarum TaxID=150122 RepID=A0ABP4K4N5_9MICO|nr:hypothetical protein [Curtobacterium herbarum]MBM7476801.1 hypothetical protein [Curtobacterium herbarum]MCS6545186.1 hypothetical protein [Curtobacterium herbarum]
MPDAIGAWLAGAALLCAGLTFALWPRRVAEFLKDVGGRTTTLARMPEQRRTAGIRVVFVSMLVLGVAANAS